MAKPRSKDIEVPEPEQGIKRTLIMVTAGNNNKYYNMTPNGEKIDIEYGRIQSSKTKIYKQLSQWNTVYKQKIRKGYKDTTDLHKAAHTVNLETDNIDFKEFFNGFASYAQLKVQSSYNASSCTPEQLAEANGVLKSISTIKNLDEINDALLNLYTIIPRNMKDVNEFLINDKKEIVKTLSREQDSLDSMDSSNIINTANPLDEMNLGFREVKNPEVFYQIFKQYQYANRFTDNVYKIYEIVADRKGFEEELENSHSRECEYLLHGTRNANVFSIMKNGLLIRPSNAHYSGSAYGDGIYHSYDVGKSWRYTGHDSDKLMFVQEVNVGVQYQYDGWYSHGKDLDVHNMNYEWMKENGYDSLFVTPGGGLQSSEYVVYNSNQTIFKYLVWFKS